MNDLMTKSFMNYVDLKKQAMKDLETGPDIEMGQVDPEDEKNLSKFFEEVGVVKAHMEEINYLLVDLQDLNEETKSSSSAKILRGLRDRINSDNVMVLRKAKIIKTRLQMLDQSNAANRSLYSEGTHIDRTRISVTNGLRVKLKGMMEDFQCLRQKMVDDHKKGLEKMVDDHKQEIENMVSGNGSVRVLEEGKGESLEEKGEREEAFILGEIQRSLGELHKVFLDMAVMAEVQGEKMNNIEENVVDAGIYAKGAAKELHRANEIRKRRRRGRVWACWLGVVLLLFFLVCLIAILF